MRRESRWYGSGSVLSEGVVFRTLVFLAGLFACIPVITVFSVSIYKVIVLLIAIYLVISGRLFFLVTGLQVFAILSLITCFITVLQLPNAYANADLSGTLSIILIALVAPCIVSDKAASVGFIDGVMVAGKLNVIWIYIQTFLSAVFAVDINDLLFTQILKMVDVASQYKVHGLVATGLCWNAGGITAALLIVFILASNPWWKLLTLLAGLLTQSSTAFIGLALCACVLILKWLKNASIVIQQKIPFGSISIVIATIAVFLFMCSVSAELQNTVISYLDITVYRINTILGTRTYDSSAQAHLGYYTNLASLLNNAGIIELFFGYGVNCSGLPYTALFGQYAALDSWAIESDIVNTLLGMGLLGCISLYYWLVKCVIRSWSTNKTVAALIAIFIICGFFYNLQSVNSYWLLLVEAALVRCALDTSSIDNSSCTSAMKACRDEQ